MVCEIDAASKVHNYGILFNLPLVEIANEYNLKCLNQLVLFQESVQMVAIINGHPVRLYKCK